MTFGKSLRALLALLLGERCVMCGRPLPGAGVCPSCWLHIPYTRLRGRPGNPLERLFWSEPNVERVGAYAWYKSEYAVARLVHAFKYHRRPDLARLVGILMAEEHMNGDFFEDLEAIVPVPLSARRLRERGYNQSEMIARGIAEVTRLPLHADWVERTVDNPSQTTLAPSERHANVAGIFTLLRPEEAAGRGILIVDDVITLGATFTSLARTFREAPGARLRLLAFCAAGQYRSGRLTPQELGLPDDTATFDTSRLRTYRPAHPSSKNVPS